MAVDSIICGHRRGKREGIPRISIIFSLSVKNERLAREGTAEPVSRDQILRRERGQRAVDHG